MMIGLDIGTKVIRACLFEGSFGRYTFSRAFEEQIPTSTLNMGGLLEDEADETEEIDPKLMAEADLERRQSGAIHALLRQLPNSSVVTHQSATQVSIRTVSLPFTDSQNIAAALPSIVEELVPFDIDDLQIQHQILNKEDNASDVLVLITQEDIIQSHLDKLEGLSINPQHILIDGDILGYYASEGVQVVLHCAENSVTCGVYRNGKTLGFRTISAELTSLDSDEPTLSTNLIERIRSTLVFFEDSHDIEIDEILLSGEGATTESLQEQLYSEMGVFCTMVAISDNIDPKWALAYALGQKGCGSTHGREFDLRHKGFSYQGNIQKLAMALQYIAILSLIGFIGFAGWFWMEMMAINKEVASLEEDLVAQIQETMPDLPSSVMSNPSTVVSLMQEEISIANDKLDKLGSITASEPPMLTLVKAISEGMPPHEQARIDVSEMVISKTSINLKAETDGFQTATEIEQALKKHPRFKQAQKADEKSMRDGIRFSIIIPLELEETEGEEG